MGRRRNRRINIGAEFQRWGNSRDRNEKPVPTKRAIPQNRRVRWESSRDMKVAQWKNMPLSMDEWDCLAGKNDVGI